MRIVAGQYRSRRLVRPDEKITRPTSDRTREAVFNILGSLSDFSLEGAAVLDAFAGSGAMGLEALSRGAAHVFFMEKNPKAMLVLKHNISELGINLEHVTLFRGDATQPPLKEKPVDLVILDPPYHQNLEIKCLQALKEKGWIGPHTLLVIETSADDKATEEKDWTPLLERTYGAAKITISRPKARDIP